MGTRCRTCTNKKERWHLIAAPDAVQYEQWREAHTGTWHLTLSDMPFIRNSLEQSVADGETSEAEAEAYFLEVMWHLQDATLCGNNVSFPEPSNLSG